MKFTVFVPAFAALALLGAGGTFAAPPPAIQSTTVLQKVFVTTGADGVQKKQIGPADKVLPGDELVYSFPTHNVGKQPATAVVITNAVPQHMQYVAGSAVGEGAEISFSIDGGKTWGKPEELLIRNANGTSMLAQAKDYTNIRWVIKEIAPGATAVVSYHAVLQ